MRSDVEVNLFGYRNEMGSVYIVCSNEFRYFVFYGIGFFP
jgi:hypothetical protein